MRFALRLCGKWRRLRDRRLIAAADELERLSMRSLLASQEVVFVKDREGRFLLVSDGLLSGAARGLRRDQVIGMTDFDLFTEPRAAGLTATEQEIIRTGDASLRRVERLCFHGRPDRLVSATKIPVRDEAGVIIGTLGISRDITAEEKLKQQLAHQALHDSLTGVPNRTALIDRLGQALAALERDPGQLVLLIADLDDFKGINDACGHQVGDQVLVEVARRLTDVAARGDTVARLGGDEFVLLFRLRPGDDVACIAERVVGAVAAPVTAGHQTLFLTCSVGVAMTSEPLTDPGDLMRQADLAMYGAKRAGRNRHELYSPMRHGREASNSRLAKDLHRAIDESQLFLVYQPIHRLDDDTLTAVEALVRWRHPTRGVLAAGEFIPVAERRGLIGAIDGFVLERACRQLSAWTASDSPLAGLTMSVNISASEFRDATLVSRVASTLERYALDPARVCIEITESAVIAELADAQRAIARLAALGVRIALDDFGTGYSTLAHVQRLPADVLKLDRSLVSQIDQAARDRALVAGVIAMAHTLGMKVLGEGVETAGQRDTLLGLDCDLSQGYLFAAPMAEDALARYEAVIRECGGLQAAREREAA